MLLDVPEPIAFYPLNECYEATEEENRQPKGILGDVAITSGPYNEPGGAYMFYGTVSSFIKFPNIGGLDTPFSITLMCWVQHEIDFGPLFSYGKDEHGFQIWLLLDIVMLSILHSNPEEDLDLTAEAIVPKGLWVHFAATYDHNTALWSLFINGHLSATVNGFHDSTNAGEVRIGATNDGDDYFEGKIAEIKVYDVALKQAQIQTSIIQGN